MEFLTQAEYHRIEADNRNLRQAIQTAKSEQTSLREQANESRRKADALLSQEGDAEELATASTTQLALAKIYDRRADDMTALIEAMPKPKGHRPPDLRQHRSGGEAHPRTSGGTAFRAPQIVGLAGGPSQSPSGGARAGR